MDPQASKPKRRPRVSLMSLFLLTALVATSITTVALWREVRPLRAEVERLRTETGQLTIVDPAKIHAVAINTLEDNTWKWRVYLPTDEGYRLATNIRRIAARPPGMSQTEWFAAAGANCATSIESGEWVVTVRLEPDPTHPNGEGHWDVRTRTMRQHGTNATVYGGGVCGTVIEWLDDKRSRGWSSDARLGGPQIVRDAEAGLELLTLRRCQITEMPNGWSSTPADPTKECDGIGVWIVPE